MDLDLWRKCEGERECVEDFIHCMRGCNRVDRECQAKCWLANEKCSCECLLVTRAQASVAVAIAAVTTCSTPEELQEKWYRCVSQCDSAEEAFGSECGGTEKKDWCLLVGPSVRQKNCACGCAGLPSTTRIDDPESWAECGGKCYTNEMACKQDLMSTEIERKDWCVAFYKKCECACVAGAAGNTAAAEYMTATEDREQLELCAFVRSCHTATCGCLEGDAECLSQCRDSCRCGCLRFPADGPDDRPAGGRLTISQCRDKMDACTTSCEPGDIGCRNSCFLEREVCNCKCAGRSSGPPEKSPTDSEENKINMYCNYLS
ncbi:balbiani ring protein 3-like [Frankliniella occidentalis]|uniref:Balbiani ring protein 3-like n=1 Tax=Frankliniella occidentalis TaxID=133901 RepID=A0A9C6WSX5_FRAOC|nr:balbiani ring protein 3-like [Frankliniella occidentalis]